MRLLLDTHVFLWWVLDDSQLRPSTVELLGNPDNDILMSSVCGWEISIKASLGRLDLPSPPVDFVPQQLHKNDFGTLPITLYHALEVYSLPPHHQDPFDRMLIAQSRTENIPIISSDSTFGRYDVEVIW